MLFEWGYAKFRLTNAALCDSQKVGRVQLRKAIRIATGLQRFQVAWFESQGKTPFELLLRLYFFLAFISKKGSTRIPWVWGMRDQIQKRAFQTQKTLDA